MAGKNSIALAALAQQPAQLAEVDWLREVMIETDIEPDFVIVVAVARRQGDRLDVGIEVLRYGHDVEPVTVGQTEIGEENLDARRAQDLRRLRRGSRGQDRIPAAGEKRSERLPRL